MMSPHECRHKTTSFIYRDYDCEALDSRLTSKRKREREREREKRPMLNIHSGICLIWILIMLYVRIYTYTHTRFVSSSPATSLLSVCVALQYRGINSHVSWLPFSRQWRKSKIHAVPVCTELSHTQRESSVKWHELISCRSSTTTKAAKTITSKLQKNPQPNSECMYLSSAWTPN